MKLKERFKEISTAVKGRLDEIKTRLVGYTFVQFIIGVVRKLGEDDASHMAGAIAYYGILSMFPLLLGIISLLGLFLSSEQVQSLIFDFVESNFPFAVGLVNDNIQSVLQFRGALGIASVVGLFWSGSAIFGAIRRILNRAWGMPTRPFYISKAIDLGLAVGAGLLFLISLGIGITAAFIGNLNLPFSSILANYGARILAFLLLLAVLLIIYRFLPNSIIPWRDVLPGAVMVAILLETARNAFIFYLANFANYQLIYGSIASVIVLLVWAYFSAFILIIGAEFISEYNLVRLRNKM